MTKLLISSALAALLAASGAAFAQDRHDDHGHPPPAHDAAPPPAAPRGPAPQAMHGPDTHHDDHRGGPPAAGPAMRQDRRGPPAGAAMRQDDRRGPPSAAAPAQNAPASRSDDRRSGGQGFNGAGNTFNRGNPGQRFAPGGSRPDFSSLRRNFNAPRHFRAPSYRRPSGWYAHRWVFGEILPRFFWAPDYWIDDFNDYALPPPPPGTVWVRDGDDALLIDRYSGEIIQVEYGVFY